MTNSFWKSEFLCSPKYYYHFLRLIKKGFSMQKYFQKLLDKKVHVDTQYLVLWTKPHGLSTGFMPGELTG